MQAVSAETSVVYFRFFDNKLYAVLFAPAVVIMCSGFGGSIVGRHVDDFAALPTHEVRVGHGVEIVVGVALVDGHLRHGSVVGEELEGVVDCRFRQCGHRRREFAVDEVGCGMVVVREQVLHYHNPLLRRLDVVPL